MNSRALECVKWYEWPLTQGTGTCRAEWLNCGSARLGGQGQGVKGGKRAVAPPFNLLTAGGQLPKKVVIVGAAAEAQPAAAKAAAHRRINFIVQWLFHWHYSSHVSIRMWTITTGMVIGWIGPFSPSIEFWLIELLWFSWAGIIITVIVNRNPITSYAVLFVC